MPRKGFLGRFKKKRVELEGKEDLSGLPQHNERVDQSMQYIESPSALEYAGIKKNVAAPTAHESKKTPEANKTKELTGELPRCPVCGWAIGFEDTVCMNCGKRLR